VVIDLNKLSKIKHPLGAMEWLISTYGPQGDRWMLRGLQYVEFRKARDADLFLLMWK
jgi:hypothetical protein